MIIRKLPLVKLLELADQIYTDPATKGPGHPYVYSQRVFFKCFMVKAVKRFDDCSGLFTYLNHEANQQIAQAVGFVEKMPCLKTFQRRFADCAPAMRHQLRSVAKVLAERGVISYEMLAVDGSMCEALGPNWHQSDKLYAHIPDKLRNLDLSAEWGKSGYHGWVYGYKAMALCNCGPGEPSVFVEGWLLRANQCETVSLRTELKENGLPTANRVLLGDTGFDDGQLFELCLEQGSLLITPLRIDDDSSLDRLQRQCLYEEWDNCYLYKRRSLSIEPLWSYVKELFDLTELHQHGIYAGEAEVLSAMVAYDLIVLYNHVEGLKPRAVKSFLDVL